MSKLHTIGQGVVVALLTTTVLSGCSHIIKSGANIALRFSENHIVPPILAMDDADMACASGNSLTPAIMATKSMGANPTRMGVLMYASAGMCAESQALEAELRYLRAAKAGRVTDAQDARIEQKRWAGLAAERQYAGYQLFANHWESKYRYKLGDSCPTMRSDLDQTVYMLGMLSGLQAMTNDINSGGMINVPKDIAGIVERGMACLDNEKFWGAPMATRAVIWTLLPGAGDGKPEPYQTLKESMAIGEKKGVRLAHAMYAVAAQATGEDAKLRDALRAYAASTGEDKPSNPQFKLFDKMAGLMVRSVADRYWAENTGVRSDAEGLTRFWDDEQESSSELDALFDGADMAAEPADASADVSSEPAEAAEQPANE